MLSRSLIVTSRTGSASSLGISSARTALAVSPAAAVGAVSLDWSCSRERASVGVGVIGLLLRRRVLAATASPVVVVWWRGLARPAAGALGRRVRRRVHLWLLGFCGRCSVEVGDLDPFSAGWSGCGGGARLDVGAHGACEVADRLARLLAEGLGDVHQRAEAVGA
jgi:hypothetical protein